MSTDLEIIQKVLSGEKDLYAELVRQNQSYLFQLCRAFLSDPHEAEEAAQEVFIKAYRSLDRFRGASSFRTWLTRIGINQCKDRLKKRRRSRAVSLDSVLESSPRLPEPLVQRPVEPSGDATLPPAALRRLTSGEKEVFKATLKRPEAGYQEIGRELGLSKDGVKGRLKRARMKIQAFLRKFGV